MKFTFTAGGYTVTCFVTIPALETIAQKLDDLKGELMALDAKTEALRKQLFDASNALGAKLQAFIDESNTKGQVTSDEINAALQPVADSLTALAAPGTVGP